MKKEWKTTLPDGTEQIRTCGWSAPGCHPVGCGMILSVKDGKVIKVEGDPEHPITQGRLCPRCLALTEVMYHPDRIIYPMKRDPKDRGLDKWERITWDEAVDLVEEKTHEIWEKYGPESIIYFTGTGRQTCLYSGPMAYTSLQSPHVLFPMSGVSCYGPRRSIADFILGAGYPEMDYAQFFPDRYDDPRYTVPECIVVWGKDPLESNGDGLFGHAVVDLMQRGSKVITIDPRLTWTGAHSEIHLPVRPGTDSALGLAFLNVIINEDLYDHEFVEEWCYGFEELRERVQEYPPSKVSRITWVPEEDILRAARMIGNAKPCTFLWGLAMDSNIYSTQAGHTFLCVCAITGNLDVPGGIVLAQERSFMGAWRMEIKDALAPGLWEKRIVDDTYPAFRDYRPESHPGTLLRLMEADPDSYHIRSAWFQGSNVMNCPLAEPQRWFETFKKLEFNVAQDLFMNPTIMAFADVFLPVATFAEMDGIVLPHFGANSHFLGAINKAVEVGEAKSDLEMDMIFGKKMYPERWQYDSIPEFFEKQIATKYPITFDELREIGALQQDNPYKKYELGLLRPDGRPGFNTPTRKVELMSTKYPDWNEDALPYYQEPDYSPYSTPDLCEKYPLILTTGGRNIESFHSEHRQVPSLRKLIPDPLIDMHPETAEKYGIEDGDWVAVENMFGRAILRANVKPIVDPRVVHCTHAWWFPEEDGEAPHLYGMWESNINTLIPEDHNGPFGMGAPYKSIICSVRKVDSKEAFGNEIPEVCYDADIRNRGREWVGSGKTPRDLQVENGGLW